MWRRIRCSRWYAYIGPHLSLPSPVDGSSCCRDGRLFFVVLVIDTSRMRSWGDAVG